MGILKVWHLCEPILTEPFEELMMRCSALSCQGLSPTPRPETKLSTRLIRDNHGVTAIEYGMLAGLIAVTLTVVMWTVGASPSTPFNTVASILTTPPAVHDGHHDHGDGGDQN